MKKLLFAFLFVSCAPHIKNETLNVEPDFVSYIEEFESFSNVRYIGGANFASTNSLSYYTKDAVAICFVYRNGDKEIKVDRGYWVFSDEDTREQLIFHELGHCALGRQHKNTNMIVSKDNEDFIMPQSIMFPVSFGGELYHLLKDYYINELINEKNALTNISL